MSPACASVCALVAAAYHLPVATAGVASASAEARESSRCPAPPRPRGGRIWAPDRCWASPERRLGLPGQWAREQWSRPRSMCRCGADSRAPAPAIVKRAKSEEGARHWLLRSYCWLKLCGLTPAPDTLCVCVVFNWSLGRCVALENVLGLARELSTLLRIIGGQI